MPLSPLAGKPAPPELSIDVDALVRAYYDRGPTPTTRSSASSFGTSGHRGTSLTARSTRRTSSPSPRPSASTARATASRPAVHRQGHARPLGARASAPRSRCWPPTASRRSSRRGDGYTPTPAISHAILDLQPRPQRRPGRRHRHHAVAQPAGRRRLQVQPAQRRPGRHRRHRAGSRTAPTSCSPAAAGRQARAVRARAARPTTARTHDFVAPYVERSGQRHRHGRRSRGAACASASIRSAAPPSATGSRIADGYGLDLDVVNPRVDPTFAFMTRRSRRQDPHGLLEPVRDGAAWSG